MSFQSVSFNPATGDFQTGTTITQKTPEVSPMVIDANLRFEWTNGQGCKVYNKHQEVGEQRIDSSEVFSTAINNGFAVRHQSDVKDSTLLTIEGLQMTAKSAAELGLIVRNADGSYSEKKPEGVTHERSVVASHATLETQQSDVTPNTNDTEPYTPELSNSELENALETVSQELGGYDALDRHAFSAISGLAKGDLSSAVGRLASAVGVEVDEAESFIAGVTEGFRTQAGNYITTKHGVNAEEVFEWAEHHLSASDKATLYHQVYMGRSGALDRLAERFKKNHR